MAARRTHSKSRNGCETCKKRRVKCDEQGPPCANCVIRNTECFYSQSATPRNSNVPYRALDSSGPGASHPTLPRHGSTYGLSSPDEPNRSPGDSGDGSSSQTQGRGLSPALHELQARERLRELRLMHHWSTKTCQSFNVGDRHLDDVWRLDVTELAFQHDFLLEIILALTCVQIAINQSEPLEISSCVSTSLKHQNKAFLTFRGALQNVSASNCDAVIGFSLVNMACSAVAMQLPAGDQDQAKTPLESVLMLYDSACAWRLLITHSAAWMKGGPFEDLLASEDTIFAQGYTRVDLTPDQLFQTKQAMQGLRLFVDHIPSNRQPSYHKALALLEQRFLGPKDLSIKYFAQCGDAFIEDARNGEPIALLILLYWGVLFDTVDRLWWTQYTGKRLVEQLSAQLHSGGKNLDWDRAVSWASQKVEAS